MSYSNTILLYCNKQLILNRASTDFDALRITGGGGDTNPKFQKCNIELSKVHWRMPVVKVNDREKSKLIKVLDSRQPLSCAFGTWDLCECPVEYLGLDEGGSSFTRVNNTIIPLIVTSTRKEKYIDLFYLDSDNK